MNAQVTAPTQLDAVVIVHQGLGRLTVSWPDGPVHEQVLPVQAFPLEAPWQGVALICETGQELLWIEHLQALTASARQAVQAALAQREFMPEITRLVAVSTFATPSVWDVQTDRGPTQLVLKGEEDIRLLPGPGPRLLINSGHGVVFLIRDLRALDRPSRKLLERFL